MNHIDDIKVGDIFSHLSYLELNNLEYRLMGKGMRLYVMDTKKSFPMAVVMDSDVSDFAN